MEKKTDLSSLLSNLDSPTMVDVSREGENGDLHNGSHKQRPIKMEAVIGGWDPQSKRKEMITGSIPSQVDGSACERWQHQNITQVYTRKRSRPQTTEIINPTTEQCSSTQVPNQQIVEVSSDSEDAIEVSYLPIALRKDERANAGVPPPRYGYEHVISNYVSYASLSPAYRAFVASLQSVVDPKDWKEANHDPKWREAMLEELRALEKNKTWDFVKLPLGKKAVSCKWIFTMKQSPEGKVERYKAKLVVRGYNQTYGID
jgi:hypothetical protein